MVDSFEMNYIDIEQLRHLSTQNLEFRKKEVHAAKILLKNHLTPNSGLSLKQHLHLPGLNSGTDFSHNSHTSKLNITKTIDLVLVTCLYLIKR